MKNPKVGDRVRKINLEGPNFLPVYRNGTIEDVRVYFCTVRYDNGGERISEHRTHLIRLKPKRKAREVFISPENMSEILKNGVGAPVHVWSPRPNIETIKFREVLSD